MWAALQGHKGEYRISQQSYLLLLNIIILYLMCLQCVAICDFLFVISRVAFYTVNTTLMQMCVFSFAFHSQMR